MTDRVRSDCRRRAWLAAMFCGVIAASMLLLFARFALAPALVSGGVVLLFSGIFLTWAFCKGRAELSTGPSPWPVAPPPVGADESGAPVGDGQARMTVSRPSAAPATVPAPDGTSTGVAADSTGHQNDLPADAERAADGGVAPTDQVTISRMAKGARGAGAEETAAQLAALGPAGVTGAAHPDVTEATTSLATGLADRVAPVAGKTADGASPKARKPATRKPASQTPAGSGAAAPKPAKAGPAATKSTAPLSGHARSAAPLNATAGKAAATSGAPAGRRAAPSGRAKPRADVPGRPSTFAASQGQPSEMPRASALDFAVTRAKSAPATTPDSVVLPSPRGGQADDLKHIRGIGPGLERLLNQAGIFHFDQIASWKARDIAQIDRMIPGFSGRITRDEWIRQAKALTGGVSRSGGQG